MWQVDGKQIGAWQPLGEERFIPLRDLTYGRHQLTVRVMSNESGGMLDERELQRLAREEEKRAKEGKKKKSDDGHNHGSMGFGGMGGTSAMQSTGDMFQRHR
jgi:hypothetical protein